MPGGTDSPCPSWQRLETIEVLLRETSVSVVVASCRDPSAKRIRGLGLSIVLGDSGMTVGVDEGLKPQEAVFKGSRSFPRRRPFPTWDRLECADGFG
jgi:hypothetical protein